MDKIILIGIILVIIGGIIVMVTPRHRRTHLWWLFQTSNPGMLWTGIIIFLVGLAVVILRAWSNGQLG